MKTDVQIAMEAKMLPITEIASRLGIEEHELDNYGRYKAKISLDVLGRLKDRPDGKLILVTAINPTPAGEGKTTTNVGLGMALNKLGKKAITTLREPSLGPCFGIKGGAAGGGYSQVVPMEDINLHFTGDIHAVTTANNLLAALIDNHIHQGNALQIDTRSITWKRAMDMNDRAMRKIVVGLQGRANGVPREDGFDISVASEVMAVLCLASGMSDLKARLGRMVIGYTYDKKPVTADMIGATGALTLLLKDAIRPNLVQTLENTPAIIHGGPFANIAHGANSVLATRTALKIADYVVTEAGFGADLGGEKFFDIKSRFADLKPNAVVIVATVRALKHHGGVKKADLGTENLDALRRGFENLEKQIENVSKFGVRSVVALNRFPTDTQAELDVVLSLCRESGAEAELSDVFARGSEGGIDLAKKVIEIAESNTGGFTPLYDVNLSIEEKINIIAKEIYGAEGVDFTKGAIKNIKAIADNGFDKVPVCMAKTQYSLSDDPQLLGRPEGFRITVSEVRLSNGAGFVVALTGNVMTMPGLPKLPAANSMDILEDGTIIGLF